jgi:histidinol-phosphate aminotransferase
LLRPELADLVAYAPVVPEGIRARLDANESPPIEAPEVREAVSRAVARVALERYPDPRATELKQRIAERTGAKASELLVGTGSDEVIALLVNALAAPRGPGGRRFVMAPVPTFVMYRVTARAHGAVPLEVPLDAAWDLDVGQMTRALETMRPNVLFIASPNNPTGNRMSQDRLTKVLDAAADVLVVIDEAYVDFAREGSLRAWRERYPNLGILRTISKLGLAALRIGWLEADEGLVREVDKARQPFNTSATSQAAAAAVMADAWEPVRAHVRAIVVERERVVAAMRRMDGVEPCPSEANFVWIKTRRPAEEVAAGLAARGILVRSFHAAGGRLATCVRISVGTAAENDAMLEALEAVAR